MPDVISELEGAAAFSQPLDDVMSRTLRKMWPSVRSRRFFPAVLCDFTRSARDIEVCAHVEAASPASPAAAASRSSSVKVQAAARRDVHYRVDVLPINGRKHEHGRLALVAGARVVACRWMIAAPASAASIEDRAIFRRSQQWTCWRGLRR
jgi:hypothetical protein